MDVIYFLTPEPYIVDCIMADFERRRYRRTFLLWTSSTFGGSRQQDQANRNAVLAPPLRERIDRSNNAREQIKSFRVLNLDYYPRESQLVTFRDPWSFPILYHPAASNLVLQHIADLAQKVTSSWLHNLR
jgi:syntaxin-binding protein 1